MARVLRTRRSRGTYFCGTEGAAGDTNEWRDTKLHTSCEMVWNDQPTTGSPGASGSADVESAVFSPAELRHCHSSCPQQQPPSGTRLWLGCGLH
jgi:hypothetical protein